MERGQEAAPGKLHFDIAGHVAWLRFDNPGKHNAMSLEMWRALRASVERAEGDRNVRVLALVGAGDKAFVSGSDVSGFGRDRTSAEAVRVYGDAVEAGLQALHDFDRPTVAVIRGFCIGGGLSIAAACDLRVGSPDAVFAVPAGRLGVGYSMGQIRRLQAIVGPGVVRELIFTGRRATAEDALRWGLLNEIVAAEDFDQGVGARLQLIAANAPMSLRAAKLASAALLRDDPEAMDRAEAAIAACFESEDYREGQRAFTERRKPSFQGR